MAIDVPQDEIQVTLEKNVFTPPKVSSILVKDQAISQFDTPLSKDSILTGDTWNIGGFQDRKKDFVEPLGKKLRDPNVQLGSLLYNVSINHNSYNESDNILALAMGNMVKAMDENPDVSQEELIRMAIDTQVRLNAGWRKHVADIGVVLVSKSGNFTAYSSGATEIVIVPKDGGLDVFGASSDETKPFIHTGQVHEGDKIYVCNENGVNLIDTDLSVEDQVSLLVKDREAGGTGKSTSGMEIQGLRKAEQPAEVPSVVSTPVETTIPSPIDRISELLLNPKLDAVSLLDAFSTLPDLHRLYDSDAMVDEGYSIRRHTLMALNQFEKYCKDAQVDGRPIDKALFRAMLAVHDLGKPLSVDATGSKKQHRLYSQDIAEKVLTDLGRTEEDVSLAKILIGQDWLGEYLQWYPYTDQKVLAEKIGRSIQVEAEKLSMKPADLYTLAKTYFMADAGAYTRDAGGEEALDYLFSFDAASNTAALSDKYRDAESVLANEVLSLSEEGSEHSFFREGRTVAEMSEVLTSGEFTNILRSFPDKVRDEVISSTLEYLIIHPDGFGLSEFLDNVGKIEEPENNFFFEESISALITKSIAQRIGVTDPTTVEGKRRIIEYYSQQTETNGYYFHAYNGVFKEAIAKHGLDPSQRLWEWEDLNEIHRIGEKTGNSMLLGWAKLNSEGNTFYQEHPNEHLYDFAVGSPEWFNIFSQKAQSLGVDMYKRNAFKRRDYDTARQNTVELCTELRKDALRRGVSFTPEDESAVLTFFDKYWQVFAGEKSTPELALIKKSAVKSDSPITFTELAETLNKSEEELSAEYGITILRHGNHDQRTSQVIPPSALTFIQFPDYKSVHTT